LVVNGQLIHNDVVRVSSAQPNNKSVFPTQLLELSLATIDNNQALESNVMFLKKSFLIGFNINSQKSILCANNHF
jgi:hypothetical protein